MRKSTGKYPKDWKEIAKRIKEKAGWKCERCGHPDDKGSGHVLTVHHLDWNRSNCADWNLAALCQRCHLHVQGKVVMSQIWMLSHSAWMQPHVDGYIKSMTEKLSYPPWAAI